MLEIAKQRVKAAANVKFQTQDCQSTSLPAASFDTAFISLVLHFTEPKRTLPEMRRILKPGGTLIIANLDFHALGGLDRARATVRILYRGATGYRLKPPKRFITKMLTETELCDLLNGRASRYSAAKQSKINPAHQTSPWNTSKPSRFEIARHFSARKIVLPHSHA